MFDLAVDILEPDRVTRYRISHGGSPLSYGAVLELWQTDSRFRSFFIALLDASPFPAYRWETPALSASTVDDPFEFVLVNSPGFCTRETDAKAYERYFTDSATDAGIVTFANLGGDATLIVPSPRAPTTAYGHLAAFVRNAPAAQVDAIWRVLGTQVYSQLNPEPVWLSTAGGGVAWLHVRIDSWPKYYAHRPYTGA